jgi:lysophospholipase L1-like esterase
MGMRGPGGRGGSLLDRIAIQGGDNSRIAHEHLVTKAKIGKGKIDVYFEGDSITRRWGCTDPSYAKFLKNWNENFYGWNAGDFGWGADLLQNILWRLQNGELDEVNPKIIVFLGGTNNLSPNGGDALVEDMTKGVKAIVETFQKKAPEATIVLTGIFPRNDGRGDPLAYIPTINKVNENIAKMADGKKIRYVNINDKLADKDGKLFPGMTVDNLHPDVKGYQIWADALKPIFTEILGAPAKVDHAPPPTGDPKVAPEYPPKAASAPAGR